MLVVILACITAGLASSVPLQKSEIAQPSADPINYRLPTDIKPSTYVLKITPNFDANTFEGSVEITIKVLKTTKIIQLHNRNLDIKLTDVIVNKVSSTDELTVKTAGNTGTSGQDFFTIELEEDLAKDQEYILHINKFLGNFLTSNRRGFYLAKYKDASNVDRTFATTHFEPTSARQAFPCFDEPALKAKFKIFITRPSTSYNAVSNMPIKETVDLTDEFEETEVMSTYLVAYIVSEMQLSPEVANNINQVLAQPSDITKKHHEHAVTIAHPIIKSIEDFVNVKYTLPKMYHAAIPDAYFTPGAMENWGLITYRQTSLLVTSRTSTSMLQGIDTIIAHELGHQWFGNLATPSWWEYIWLSEGFATYFQYMAADEANPEWKLMEQFVLLVTQNTFKADSVNTTRPMNQEVGSPNEISALFDQIAYGKSGAVIRMMESFLTTAVFKAGLKNYLDARKYEEGTPDYLYENLQKALDSSKHKLPKELTVSKIMKSWDSQKGFPLVTAIRSYGDNSAEVKLYQSRFVTDKSDTKAVWNVPINYATASNSNFTDTSATDWLIKNNDTMTVTDLKNEDWIILNKQEAYYYRVNYDDNNWDLLTNALKEDPTKIHTLSRAQLLDDSFNLARIDTIKYSVPLNISAYLEKETEYVPLQSFLRALSFLDTMTSGTEPRDHLEEYVLSILENAYSGLNFEEKKNDTLTEKLNRVGMISWMCRYGHSNCLESSLNTFVEWREKGTKIPLDLEGAILCGAMRTADEEHWQYLYANWTKDEFVQSDVVNALGCSTNKLILQSFLDSSLEKDALTTFKNAVSSLLKAGPVGVETSLEYVLNYFKFLHLIVSDSDMTSILIEIGSKLTTEEQVQQLEVLSTQYSNKANLFEKAITNAKENVAWNAAHLGDIDSWFLDRKKSNGALLLHIPLGLCVLLVSLLQILK